jgi:hypothetical protein
MPPKIACRAPRTVAHQHEEPTWEPLLDAVGEELTAGFMWMHEETLEDGTRVQAYKHRYTRRYLYLGAGGAFARTPCDRLAPTRLDGAVEGALCSWWITSGEDDDRELIRAAIERIQSRIDMTQQRGWLEHRQTACRHVPTGVASDS